jgi:hypothetical protein
MMKTILGLVFHIKMNISNVIGYKNGIFLQAQDWHISFTQKCLISKRANIDLLFAGPEPKTYFLTHPSFHPSTYGALQNRNLWHWFGQSL